MKFSREVIGDLGAIFLNPVPSTIPKWRAFKHVRCMQNLNQSTREHDIFCMLIELQKMNNFSKTKVEKNQKYEIAWPFR